ncbi:MAG: tubulin-like doman-containing protein, partial [Nitrososphaerota archaeon]
MQDVNLQRALIIGLGGTGGEVLVRTRRLLIDFFGGLENIPIVRFLYIDTDLGWWQEQISKVEKKVQLAPIEFVNAS